MMNIDKIIENEKRDRTGYLEIGCCDLNQIPDLSELEWLETLVVSNEWIDLRDHQYYKFSPGRKYHDTRVSYQQSKNKGKENLIIASPAGSIFPKRLKKLVLAGSRFNSWGIQDLDFLRDLTDLVYLDVSYNAISDASDFRQLVHLAYLDIKGNPIEDFTFLNEIDTLEFAGVFPTYCKTLSEDSYHTLHKIFLSNLDGLRAIKTQAVKNQLYEEAADVRDVESKATVLFFEQKQFELLIEKFWPHPNLFPQCSSPSTAIIREGHEAILEFYRQKKKSGARPLLEAKLVLLGDGRAGKTTLACQLLGKPIPKDTDRTQRIDIIIGQYTFQVQEGAFKLHIWDFAGQDKYKPLHQFFYTEGAVYVLVADSGNANTDFDDWFQTAQLFGSGSPLIVALNEFREGIGAGAFEEERWRKQFPQLIKEVRLVNLVEKTGFAVLEKDIQHFAETLPHVREEYPANWANIRNILESRRDENFIKLDEYRKICKDNDLPEKESTMILSGILHKIGVCLHYQENRVLRQYVILKNEWATDAVYRMLEDNRVAVEKRGFFDWSDLERIWADEQYCEMQPQLLELMQRFKMAYPLPVRDEFITPLLLPLAPPDDWKLPEADTLKLLLEYSFLPKMLLTQFIVSRHTDIAEGRTLVWRNGVVLCWQGALAEVSRLKSRGRESIQLLVQGRERRALLTSILGTFRELHADYKGIEVSEVIPCPCEGCSTGQNTPHYFEFSNLKNRLEKGRRKVECDKSLDEIDLVNLLGGLLVFEQLEVGQPVVMREQKREQERKTLRVFLASSAELQPERDRIEKAVNRINKKLNESGIFIFLSQWEDSQCIGKAFRSQDNYNEEVLACDVFVLLFYSRLGKYTREEFDLAKKRHETEKHPRILSFKKNAALPSQISVKDLKSLRDFETYLNKNDHFPTLFDNTDALIHSLEDALDKLLRDQVFCIRLKT